MNRTSRRALLILAATMLLVAPAWANSRIALVVGNSGYRNLPALANPAEDARLLGATLKRVGFEVAIGTDLDRAGMQAAIGAFGNRLQAAGPDAVGLFYFAGHVAQVLDADYMIPIAAPIDRDQDVGTYAVGLSDVFRELEDAGNRVNFVVFDSCQTYRKPRDLRAVSKTTLPPRGTFVAYAARRGGPADGDTCRRSPFTKVLAELMLEPGVPAEELFKRVRSTVMTRTGTAQIPTAFSAMTGEFYFRPKP